MTPSFLLALLSLACLLPSAMAQEDTAAHRAAYQKINDGESSYRKVAAKKKIEEKEFQLTGWFDGAKLVKMSAIEGGSLTEFYLQEGEPLFVYRTWNQGSKDGKKATKVTERLYFKDGAVFKWLTDEQPQPVLHGEDYEATTGQLCSQVKAFAAALRNPAPAAPAGLVVEGVFKGLEEGDYAHWKMRTRDGREVSYFVLKPDAAVEKVLEKPDSFIGKSCKVTLKKGMEEIQEGGGKMEIEQVVSVEWVE